MAHDRLCGCHIFGLASSSKKICYGLPVLRYSVVTFPHLERSVAKFLAVIMHISFVIVISVLAKSFKIYRFGLYV